MSKRNKIIYWVSTVWLALGMTVSGVSQLIQTQADKDFITALGYPTYFLSLLGLWKILGVIALFLPKRPLLKEWAYAGFFFTMSGALYSHIAMNNPFSDIFPPILLLVLIMTSWYFRPADKKINMGVVAN